MGADRILRAFAHVGAVIVPEFVEFTDRVVADEGGIVFVAEGLSTVVGS